MRNNFVQDQSTRNAKAYRIDVLLHAVVTSGMLKHAADLKLAAIFTIKMTVPDASVRQYLLERLEDSKACPSPTTLYRHRLTLHMSMNRFIGEANEELLQTRGGVCSWRSYDLSPHGGVEWVLHGASVMLQSQLAEAFLLFLTLVSSQANLEEAFDALSKFLHMEQGMPVGVGSGRKGLKYKIHGAIHAQRLMATSWLSACKLLNSTFAIVGDLGESTMVKFKCNITRFVGGWITDGFAEEDT